MMELFAVGGFLFWALIVTELILLFVFTEYENGICATVSVVAFIAILQFCSKVNVAGYVWEHPIQLAVAVVAYLIFGVCWGIFKWRRLVVFRLHEHDDALARFCADHKLPEGTTVLPPEYRNAWRKFLDSNKSFDGPFAGQTFADTPLARKNKARITRWMSLWVFSVLLYLLKDMVVEAFTVMYYRLAKFLQRIADNIYSRSNIKANLEVPPPAPPVEATGQ